jgi:hypothetical protein
MMIHTPKWPERRRDPLPADSGEWPRVRIKYRNLSRATLAVGRVRYAAAIVAGVVVWPLPLLLVFAASYIGALFAMVMLVFPLHTGMVVAFVLGRRANDHARFMAALLSILTAVLVGCTVGLVNALLSGASWPDLFAVFVGGAYCVMVCSPGAVAGSYVGGRLTKRLFSGNDEPEQQPIQNKHHAGAVPYYYPRTTSQPRHG